MKGSEQRTPEFFDGKVLRQASVTGLALGEILYPSGYERPTHAHKSACFHFLLQGGYTEYRGRLAYEAKTFTLSFQPEGHEHSYRGTEIISRAFTIELEPSWVARLREHSLTLDSPSNFQGGLITWLISRLYREFRVMESASPLVIEALALETAVEAARRKGRLSESRPPIWLKRAEDLLRSQFADSLSLQSIALAVGVHPVHLARVFRQHYHCTVGEYLRRLRVEYACQQMIRSNSPLLEIALAAGFSDQSQFSRTFKRAMGLTPGEFRAASRAR